MHATEYTDALRQDIHRLKNTALEIPSARVFYRQVALRLLGLYLIIVGFPWFITILINTSKYSLRFYFEDVLILSVLFAMCCVFFLPKIAEYVTFKEAIKPQLVLGNLVNAKFKLFYYVFISVYVIWSTLYSGLFFTDDFSHIGERAFTLVPGVIFGIMSASVLFQMEIARVGLGTLFEIISSFKSTHVLTHKT